MTRILFLALSLFLPFLVPGGSPANQWEPANASARRVHAMEAAATRTAPLLAQRNDRSRNRYEQWQGMKPAEKEALRHRMDRWNQMDPQDRQRYQQRYNQWKGLSRDEQRQIDRKLDKWKDLSPAEKEDVRKKFR